jgi:hypothetical protein
MIKLACLVLGVCRFRRRAPFSVFTFQSIGGRYASFLLLFHVLGTWAFLLADLSIFILPYLYYWPPVPGVLTLFFCSSTLGLHLRLAGGLQPL